MSWDEAHRQLEQEFGHEPCSGEVQKRMLEIAMSKTDDESGDQVLLAKRK
jgi:hypothetical protein